MGDTLELSFTLFLSLAYLFEVLEQSIGGAYLQRGSP